MAGLTDGDAPLTETQPNVPPTVDNPLEQTPEETIQNLGIAEEDKNRLVETVTLYRTGWAPDRLLRMALWTRNDLMYRGRQLLGWDQQQGVYYDALALYMQSGEQNEGDDTYLQAFQNNITKMLGTAFIGTMARSVPPTVIRPENAVVLSDVTTAKAGQEAIAIIERMNDIRGLLRNENTMLYLYGCYFKHTRPVIDGAWAGYDEEPEVKMQAQMLPDRYHCSQCGKDVPVGESVPSDSEGATGSLIGQDPDSSTEDAGSAGQGKQCPCGNSLGPANFYPAEQGDELEIVVGTKKVPRAMVKWTVHGPMEFDADPEAKKLKDSPIGALDMEVDIGTLRRIFPKAKIQDGAQVSTTPNAGFERLRRNESYSQGNSYTSDSFQAKPTYSQVWMQPESYYRLGLDEKDSDGKTFADRMMDVGPEGLKLSMVGDQVVDIRPAVFEKEWTHCVLIEGCGLYPPSVADDVVPFNIRINGAMDILDDHYQRCSTGIIIADGSKLDRRELAGKRMESGVLNFIKTKSLGQAEPLTNVITQFMPQVDASLREYVPMLWNLAQQIASLPPQVFGVGTQEGVDTASGQAQQLSQAQLGLNVFFENEKVEHAEASQNAIECLQKAHQDGLMNEIWDVEEANGSEFRNKYVDLGKMTGRIRVYPQPDAGLPQSPEQLRDLYKELIGMAGGANPNPIVAEMLDCVANQETVLASIGGEDMVLPSATQRSRTLQHINILLEKQGPMVIQPQPDGTVATSNDLPVKPQIGYEQSFPVLIATIEEFRCENWDEEQSNPEGWQRLEQYYQLALQLEAQQSAQQAQRKKMVMAAGQPSPDPQEQQAKQLLLADGAKAVQDLANIAAIPPAIAIPGKALPAVVSAAGKILDNALKAADR